MSFQRRSGIFSLMFLYLVGTGALPMSIHYCGGKLAAIVVDVGDWISRSESCCQEMTSCAADDSCCTDEPIEAESDVDQLLVLSEELQEMAMAESTTSYSSSLRELARRLPFIRDLDLEILPSRAMRIQMSSLIFYA